MTITARVYELIFDELEINSDGLRWTELLNLIKEKLPDVHPKTTNGLVWKLIEKNPDKVYKTDDGKFRLLKHKEA